MLLNRLLLNLDILRVFQWQVEPEAIGQTVRYGGLLGDAGFDGVLRELEGFGIDCVEDDLRVGVAEDVARDLVEEEDETEPVERGGWVGGCYYGGGGYGGGFDYFYLGGEVGSNHMRGNYFRQQGDSKGVSSRAVIQLTGRLCRIRRFGGTSGLLSPWGGGLSLRR